MGEGHLEDTRRYPVILFEAGPGGWWQPRSEWVAVGVLRRVPQVDHEFPNCLRGHPGIRPRVVRQVQLDDPDAVLAGRRRQGGPQRLPGYCERLQLRESPSHDRIKERLTAAPMPSR